MFSFLRSLRCSLVLVLFGLPALAQEPSAPSQLDQQPTLPTPAPSTAAPAAATTADPYLLGRTYRVETVQGTSFTGTLVSISLTKLEFDTPETGRVSLERTQIRRADLQGPAAASVRTKSGYFDIGNGNRLFFAPTARGLRKGENTLQTVNLFLVGGNFGITDNISLGGYVTLFPGAGLDNQFLVLTPKVSFPVSENLHFGAGAVYLRIPDFDGTLDRSYGAGIMYGAVTYGSADNNVTGGLGYGFFEGEVGSTPILLAGGQKRISRRISLISENYIVADSRAGLGGLYGVKINWRRTSLGLGALYAYEFGYEDNSNGQTFRYPGTGFTTYILPVYYDFTFRFGKGVK